MITLSDIFRKKGDYATSLSALNKTLEIIKQEFLVITVHVMYINKNENTSGI